MSKREASAEIDEAAASWALRIDDAGLDDMERAAFELWLGGDVRRAGAFSRAQAVLVHVKRAKALGSDFEPASFGQDWKEAETVHQIAEEEPRARGLTRRKLLIGASALAATGTLAFVLPAGHASATIYETRRGEVRLVPLADGATVILNTDSRIAVTIDGPRRAVLLDRGEALFKVATADRMPFMVEAGDASLRARHATFTVCRLGERPLQVKVCEGDVEVARRLMFAIRKTRLLRANMQAVIPADGAIVDRSVTPEALQRELAWQEGMLAFEDTPLRQAADEFARYSSRRILIADPLVASETVTGLYAANNPEGFARAVALGLNLRMQTTPGGIELAR